MSNLSTISFSHTTETDVTEDFELPEYQPEVRRVVGVQCHVTRDRGFLEERAMEVSGCVLYTVVYLTGDGGLCSLPFFSTWEMKLPLPEGTSVSLDDVHCICESENALCRVTGPRKLTLSAKVKLSCLALGKLHCDTDADSDTVSRTVFHTEELPFISMKTCQGSGTVRGETGGGKVITCQGNVQITEVRRTTETGTTVSGTTETGTTVSGTTEAGTAEAGTASAGSLVIDGEASVRFLVQGDSGAYVPLRSRMPIHETLPCPSTADWEAPVSVTASGICAALTVTEEDDRIRWEMEYDLEGTLCHEGRTTITTDGYCTTHAYTPHCKEVQAMTTGRCIRGQVTLTGEKKLTGVEGVEALQFLYGWGKGRFVRAEQVDDKRILIGNATCTVFLTGNGDIVTEEVTLPIRYEIDATAETELPLCQVRFSLWDVGGHMEGDTLHLHAEMGFDGLLLGSTSRQYLDALIIDESAPFPPSRPSITLYTPSPTETAWDVQKRYRTANVRPINVSTINVLENGERYVVRK